MWCLPICGPQTQAASSPDPTWVCAVCLFCSAMWAVFTTFTLPRRATRRWLGHVYRARFLHHTDLFSYLSGSNSGDDMWNISCKQRTSPVSAESSLLSVVQSFGVALWLWSLHPSCWAGAHLLPGLIGHLHGYTADTLLECVWVRSRNCILHSWLWAWLWA